MNLPLICTLLFLISISSSQIFSQDDVKQERENSLKAGEWALQFAIDQNFSLSNFEGSTISIKKQLSDKRALRLGVSLSFGKDKTNGSSTSGNDTSKQTGNGTNYGVYLYPTYFFYVNPKAAVNLYIGAGIKIGGSFYKSESESPISQGGYYYNYDRDYTYNAGLTGTMGVEFFPIKNLSIFAEYAAAFEYIYQNSYDYSSSPGSFSRDEYKTDRLQFDGRYVNFGLSVYF